MEHFEINIHGNVLIKNKTKDFYKVIIGGFIIYVIFCIASIFTIESKFYFILVTIFQSVIYLVICVLLPINIIVTRNKVIRWIDINGNHIVVLTNKKCEYSKNEFEFKEVKNHFNGFGNREKDGILVKKIVSGKEYWIVEDFFNNYEELKIALMKHDN
jgi:hypothetical protein